MTLRNITASLALAAGSLLFVAQPALQAQDYGYSRPYDNRGYYGYDNGRRGYDREERWERDRQRRYEHQLASIQHEREELDRALYRRDYRAARREEREIAEKERRLYYEFGRGNGNRNWR